MKRILLSLVAAIGFLAPASGSEPPKFTYVIVHGGFAGGYDWKDVDALLTAHGHKVYRPTLTGLGEKAHLASPTINLTTHVDDIVNLIKYESLTNVILLGHSYGGMVITGVMDRIPERLAHVIFLDAAVPNDGESFLAFWKAIGIPEVVADAKPENGFWAPSFVDLTKPPPSEVRQSWNTFSEPVHFNNPAAKKVKTTYIFCVDGKPQGLKGFLEIPFGRRITERGWKIEVLDSDHLANRTHPKELAALMEKISSSAE
jgi:pimeloyl-ACP methyl ester carboxylesterase